jgi:Rrf2 family cysteine metabolism transcriptional repressor
MKFSTRARYGLRMMVELARLESRSSLVQLKEIARVTGLSGNYLGQLAMSLRNSGLLIGVSGKRGGYKLSRPAEQITLREIIRAVHGPIFATECVVNPHICLNAEFCEARTIWALLTHRLQGILDEYTLADLISPKWMSSLNESHPDVTYLDPVGMISQSEGERPPGCPAESAKNVAENT